MPQSDQLPPEPSEGSEASQMAREMGNTSSTRLYFPYCCYPLQWIIRGCAVCLGFSSHDSQDPSEQEAGMPTTEERSIVPGLGLRSPRKPPTNVGTGGSVNSVLMASRSPSKPPPSEGRGGQINSASSSFALKK